MKKKKEQRSGKERRAGENRRKFDDLNYKEPERRRCQDRRISKEDRRKSK